MYACYAVYALDVGLHSCHLKVLMLIMMAYSRQSHMSGLVQATAVSPEHD